MVIPFLIQQRLLQLIGLRGLKEILLYTKIQEIQLGTLILFNGENHKTDKDTIVIVNRKDNVKSSKENTLLILTQI